MPLKICCIIDDDLIWGLPVWSATMPKLISFGYEVNKLWVLPPKLGKFKGINIYLWYLKNLGIICFIKLCLFSIVRKFSIIISGIKFKDYPSNFKKLASIYSIEFQKIYSLKDEHFLREINDLNIDIMVIMTSHKIPKNILNKPNIGTINKHASNLPENKGMFPFIWAALNNNDQAVSFHLVEEKIDEGDLLFQKIFLNRKFSSMMKFYDYVFARYPSDLITAIENLLSKSYLKKDSNKKGNYNSLPGKKEMRIFFKKGFKVVKFRDIISQLRIPLYL